MNIIVSIILSSYNAEKFIIPAVQSALNQDFDHFEVIVVDDGSTDHSVEKLIRINDPHLKVITKQNEGQASAMNVGFAASSGDIICFLDGDDLSYASRIKTIYSDFLKYPEVVGVMHSLEEIDAQGKPRFNPWKIPRIVRARPPAVKENIFDLYFWLRETGARHLYTVTSGLAYRRKVLEKIFPLPTKNWRTCPDHLLITLGAFFGPVLIEDQVLGAYRIHGNNNIFLVDNEKLLVQLAKEVKAYANSMGFQDGSLDLSKNYFLRRGRYYQNGQFNRNEAIAILNQIRTWPGLTPQSRLRQMLTFFVRNLQIVIKNSFSF